MYKRVISIALAIVMTISSASCALFAYATPYQSGNPLPYYDEETKIYYRETTRENGEKEVLQFYTDYDQVVDLFRQHLMNRDSDFTIKFATTDEQFAYDPSSVESRSSQTYRLINKVMYDSFTTDLDNPFAGDFLYHSINMSGKGFTPSAITYNTNLDILDGQQYYCYDLCMSNVDYYTDNKQEKYFERFVEKFKEEYISPNDTDYQKVKIIYDFVVRNVTYDYDVYNSKDTNEISKDDPRFRSAHSGYGAVCGNIKLNDNEKSFADQYENETLDFDNHFNKFFTPIETVESQKIEDSSDWGLAVCEGFSKFFYALCIASGVPCHIVDGNYAEGELDENGVQLSDAHEWNCVYLDDGVGDDGYQWYEIDTTFASQDSIKSIDYNNYNFFLVGTSNEVMNKRRHQVPYHVEYNDFGDVAVFNMTEDSDYEHQLYDWYNNETALSVTDYEYPKYNFVDVDSVEVHDRLKSGILISRTYEYKGETRTAFILSEKTDDGNYDYVRVEINEDGKVVHSLYNEKGFPYRSVPDTEYTYHFMIPYVVNTGNEYDICVDSSKTTTLVNEGNYDIEIKGQGKSFIINVPIIPLDMNGNYDNNERTGNYSSAKIENQALYTGANIVPSAEIYDGFEYQLVEGKDYDIRIYKDPLYTQLTDIKNIGTYYVRIEYKGNYNGFYKFIFIVGKLDLSHLKDQTYYFNYVPKKLRKDFKNIAEYYSAGAINMKVGDTNLYPNKDYAISFDTSSNDSTGMAYGASGNIILTGATGSEYVKPNTVKKFKYEVSNKFDISNPDLKLDGQYACSKAFVYTGSPIKPDVLDNVNTILDADEYNIVKDSYSNCTDAGEAKLAIEGIGGCKGRVTMRYIIQKKVIDNSIVNVVNSGNDLYIDLSYNGMTLAPNVDYIVKKETNKITIAATSSSNYYGTYVINGTNVGTLNIVYDRAPSHVHEKVATLTKATATKNGKIVYTCRTCGKALSTTTIYYPKTVTLSATKYTYDGKTHKPSVKVVDANGETIASSNYTVTYPSGLKNVGKYTVKITFKGDYYSGTVSKTFTIVPKTTSISSLTATSKGFTVKWKKQATQTTGYQIQIATDSKFTKGVKSYDVTKNSTVSKKITKLTGKKKYYVRIRTYKTVSGTKYYSSYSGSKYVTTKK